MSQKVISDFGEKFLKKMPELRPGQVVRVHQKIVEGEKERVQVFEGIIIAKGSGSGVSKTFTVRKVVEGVGVEKVFPVHSPLIVKVELKRTSKVRRAKLYFLRGRTGKAAKLYGEDAPEAKKAAGKAV